MVSEVQSGWQTSLQSGLEACSRHDYGNAKEFFSKALEQAHHESAPEHSIGEIFFNIAWCHQALGDYQAAEQKYKQSLGTVERCYGVGSEAAVKVLQQLSGMYRSANRLDEAEAYAQRARLSQTPSDEQAPGTVVPQMQQTQQREEHKNQSRSPEPPRSQKHLAGTASEETPSAPPAGRPLAPSSPSEAPAPQKRKLPRALATASGDDRDLDYDEIISDSGESQGPFVIEELVHPREKFYSKLSGAIGCYIYFLSVIFFGIGFLIAPLAWLGSFISQGLYLGNLRGSGIRVSNRQFPEVQKYLEQYCTILRMEVPEVYVVNHDGLLNAFAQRLHKKDIVVICSDVLELAYEHGEKELAFVVVHELGHLKLGHLKWHWLHIPGHMVPFLGTAYSRACEYSCDRIARHLVPDGALFGLVALAAGTKLYRNINLNALYEQAEHDWGFWTWFSEIQSTHPNLLNRIRAIGIKDAEVRKRIGNRG